RAETAVYANVGADPVLRAAREAGTLVRLLEGDDAACDFLATLATECGMLDDLRLAWDIASVARPWLGPKRRDDSYAVIRSYELAEHEFNDPSHPGIPLDTPERRELREAARTNPSAGSALFNPFMESRAQARDVLRAPL